MKNKTWLLPSTIVLISTIILISSFEFIPIINNFLIATLLISYILTIISVIMTVFKVDRIHKLFKFLFSASIAIFGGYLFIWIFLIASVTFSSPKTLEYNNKIYYYELKEAPTDMYIVSEKTSMLTRKVIFHKYTKDFSNSEDAVLNEKNTIKIINEIEK